MGHHGCRFGTGASGCPSPVALEENPSKATERSLQQNWVHGLRARASASARDPGLHSKHLLLPPPGWSSLIHSPSSRRQGLCSASPFSILTSMLLCACLACLVFTPPSRSLPVFLETLTPPVASSCFHSPHLTHCESTALHNLSQGPALRLSSLAEDTAPGSAPLWAPSSLPTDLPEPPHVEQGLPVLCALPLSFLSWPNREIYRIHPSPFASPALRLKSLSSGCTCPVFMTLRC